MVLCIIFYFILCVSVTLMRIRIGSVPMFWGLLDPDPLVRVSDPDPSIIKAKILRKTLIRLAQSAFLKPKILCYGSVSGIRCLFDPWIPNPYF
jgi:hypothetical protein